MRSLIAKIYILLALLTPLIFTTKLSEIFELPKIVFVYLSAIIIVSLWATRIITEKKLIFRRSILDIPLLIFLATLIISTFFSIDFLTSVQGYYSRFYGGLISIVAYSAIYWAAVSNLTKKDLPKILNGLLLSAVTISILAILEHFGIGPTCLFVNGKLSTSCWAQNIQDRPFATLGQPNWLAAYLAMTIPLVWERLTNSRINKSKYFFLSLLIFVAILFTKSFSGLLAFGGAFAIFWGRKLVINRQSLPMALAVCCLLLFIIFNPINTRRPENPDPTVTASSDIRLLLWKGALDIWKQNPVVGTGPETFAYSYYSVRPLEHNFTSEWNFVYNKAHNEYFNYLSNAGIIGLGGYLILILCSIRQMGVKKVAFLSGYISLLISNAFNFTVVTTGLLFFLYPAFAAMQDTKMQKHRNIKYSSVTKYCLLVIAFLITCYLLLITLRFAYADYLYSRNNYLNVKRSTELINYQPQYWEKLGSIYADSGSDYLADQSLQKALGLSGANIKLNKNIAIEYLKLGSYDDKYYDEAIEILSKIKSSAPTDPMIPYFEGLAEVNLKHNANAKELFSESLILKPNYQDVKDALMLIEADN